MRCRPDDDRACLLCGRAVEHAARLLSHGLAPLWPFSGVAIGIVLISSGAYKIAAVAGAILALLAFNPSMGQSAGEGMNFIVGHALELALILLIVKRVAALPFEIRRFRDLVVLFGATLVAAALSGVVVALGLKAAAFSATSVVNSWWAWVASHVVGVTTIAPAIAILASAARRWRGMSQADTAGLIGLLVLLALIYALFFSKLELASPLAIANVAILLPVMLWIAMRCPPPFPLSRCSRSRPP